MSKIRKTQISFIPESEIGGKYQLVRVVNPKSLLKEENSYLLKFEEVLDEETKEKIKIPSEAYECLTHYSENGERKVRAIEDDGEDAGLFALILNQALEDLKKENIPLKRRRITRHEARFGGFTRKQTPSEFFSNPLG